MRLNTSFSRRTRRAYLAGWPGWSLRPRWTCNTSTARHPGGAHDPRCNLVALSTFGIMTNKHLFLPKSGPYLLYSFISLLQRIEIMLDERFKADEHGLANREISPTWFPYFQAPRKENRSQTKPVFFSPHFPVWPRDAATDQQPSRTDTPPTE
jgi:hypothetical protein